MLLVVASLAMTPSLIAECDGHWNIIWGFTCTSACTEGCATTSVSTDIGAGRMCICDIIGPDADCCRLVIVPLDGGGHALTHSGDCSSPGCDDQQGSGCIVVSTVYNGTPINATAQCQ
jgi:hypothetical protein